MKNSSSNTHALWAGILAISTAGALDAKDLSETTGVFDALANVNETAFMKDLGLTLGGFINTGITYNANDPGDNFNGPVTFGDRSGELQLNEFYVYLQRAVNTESDAWDFGGRADFLFGTDAVFTQAYGVPPSEVDRIQPLQRGHWDLNLINGGNRFYDIALPQVYGEIFAPIGNGLTAKIGHFYTPIGYETVPAIENFFYTKPYTFQYGEPFTHTGVLLTYPIDDNWTVIGGGVTGSATGGWDGSWDRQLGNWAFLGGVTWTTDDKDTSVTVNGTSGETSEHNRNNWSLYSLVFKHNFTEKLHYVLQHDHGFANKVLTLNGVEDARWYGVNQYLMYDIQDDLSAGIRAEWFRDDDGFRVFSPARVAAYAPAAGPAGFPAIQTTGGSYYEITAGLAWKPLKWFTVRPNIRYDWVDGPKVFEGGTKTSQFLFSTDVVLAF